MRRVCFFILSLSIGFSAMGQQDKHFSFFAESPIYMNPAAAGFHAGHLQFYSNFRMQWMTASDQPWMTSSAALDWRMFDKGNGFLGMGAQFYNDISGAGNYMVNSASIPINYAIQISEENHFAIGLQPAWYSRTMNTAPLTWDNQWNGVEFNTGLESGEVIPNENMSINKFDMAAGVYWYANLSDQVRLAFGASGQHLTKQKINFYGSGDTLYRKVTVHGQAEFRKKKSNVSIMPAFAAFFQGPNKSIVAGSNFKFHLQSASLHTGHFEEMTFSLGSYYRFGDALLFNMIFEISGFAIGANYDLNISSTTTATSGVGAMEFFLRWKIRFGGRHLSNPQIH